MYACMRACGCACARAHVRLRILRHSSLHKAHVGAHIFCRMGTLDDYMGADPQWRSIGAMGTEGSEGATPSDDVPESWGWTLEDATTLQAAAQVHLT